MALDAGKSDKAIWELCTSVALGILYVLELYFRIRQDRLLKRLIEKVEGRGAADPLSGQSASSRG
jgi:hypothetical protein